jgi:hypothetical protein
MLQRPQQPPIQHQTHPPQHNVAPSQTSSFPLAPPPSSSSSSVRLPIPPLLPLSSSNTNQLHHSISSPSISSTILTPHGGHSSGILSGLPPLPRPPHRGSINEVKLKRAGTYQSLLFDNLLF